MRNERGGAETALKRRRKDSDVLTENDLKMLTYEKREGNAATGMGDVSGGQDFEDVVAGTISSAGNAVEVDDLNDDEDWVFDDESDNEISFGRRRFEMGAGKMKIQMTKNLR